MVVPEQEFRRRSARQSIAFFVHPDDQVRLGGGDDFGGPHLDLGLDQVECSPLGGPDPRYPPVTALGHLENRQTPKYVCEGFGQQTANPLKSTLSPTGSAPPMETSSSMKMGLESMIYYLFRIQATKHLKGGFSKLDKFTNAP